MNERDLTADPAVRSAARAAARRLAEEFDPALPLHVETALATDGADRPADQFAVDLIALGSLVVSAAGLAWSILKDLHEPPADHTREIARRIRLELPADDAVPAEQRDRVVAVVVEEIVEEITREE